MRESPIAGVAYMVVQTENVDAWCDFAGNLLGMMPSALSLPEGTRAYRMDDRMARFILTRGPDCLAAVGWDVAGLPEWEDLHVRLDKAGVQAQSVSRQEAHHRGASEVCRVQDPSGAVVEFALRPMADPIDHFVSPLGVRFVTGDQGMGHVTAAVANYEETVDFYTGVLGFGVRETIDLAIRATFCSPNPRHHTIALIDGHGENHVHHVMVEVDSIDDVGRCLDKVESGAAAQTATLGRHFNDLMTSFYMASPSGLQVEYGYGGRRVDAGEWVEQAQGGVGGGSLWGHRPVESAHHEAVAEGFHRVEARG